MQLTRLQFNFQLHPSDLRAFRAAIVEIIGLGHHLFHGHDNSEPGKDQYSNAYPLIRFAVRKGRAQIIGMGAGADAIIRHLLPVLPSTLVIAGRPCSLTDWRISNQEWQPELLPEYRTFGLRSWIALNGNNYQAWKDHADNDSARRVILDRCLTGHLRALAENSDPSLARERIIARVLRLDRVKKTQWKNVPLITFDLIAEANFLPPNGLGLGRCQSFGFGEVCSERTYLALTSQKQKRRGKPLEAGENSGLEVAD